LTELRCASIRDRRFASSAVDIQREPLRRVERAFQAFFRRVKAGQKASDPRFRSRDRYDSFAWHRPKLRAEGWLVPNLGRIRFQASRILEVRSKWRPSSAVAIRDQWTSRIVMDIGPERKKRVVISAIGMVVGLTTTGHTAGVYAIAVNPRG
jgi:putative transposase